MALNVEKYREITGELLLHGVTLVAVSKTKSIEDIQALYDLGQRDFGENYVQELVDKQAALPKDIRWHFIGHLQSNKVKYIAPFVHLIHGVDSYKLLNELNKQAAKSGRVINCLLQVHIAQEETKFGMDAKELEEAVGHIGEWKDLRICGLMGMASLTNDMQKAGGEFRYLKGLLDKYIVPSVVNRELPVLSMGMSGDYRIAVAEGSTMVRIGSLLFGARV
jgi:hypothetical protein